MSIRPKRKAAQIRSLNEDQMFMDQYIFDEPEQPPVPQVQSKFVKPKTRIPLQQQPVRLNMIPERVVIVQTRPSLKAYLSSSLVSKTMRTSIWRTSMVREYDSNSYIRSFKMRNLIIENKRKWKERMKRFNEEVEYQRQFQIRDFNEDLSLFRDYYPTPELGNSQYYSKQRNTFIDRCNLSKVNSEVAHIIKNPRDEIARNIEESEKRSTAVSCQERHSQKEIRLRSPPQNHYEDYHIEAEISNYDIHNIEEKNDRERNQMARV